MHALMANPLSTRKFTTARARTRCLKVYLHLPEDKVGGQCLILRQFYLFIFYFSWHLVCCDVQYDVAQYGF